ncbi:MAG: LD-carboxypeptidase [Muribaculaceae bacterium]|nr:LD-carboxypeptidase [Muribaculaceae bacterium]
MKGATIKDIIKPAPLREGDKIAIISPATTVKEEYITGAADMLRREGFRVEIMPSAYGPADGSYASSLETRLADLSSALLDPDVKCILCARGGYGCNQLLPYISAEEICENPKWLIGFSDISALHALWLTSGVASLHAHMAKHLTLLPPDDPATSALLGILRGERTMDYIVEPSPFNRLGEATGRLQGGNLAVLNGLAATPYDILQVQPDEDVILFIEDISEAIYAVERMLIRLDFADVLGRIKGLIVGQFTEYRPDRNFSTMEEMISALLSRRGINNIPVAFNFPVGHVDFNLPLIEGERVKLTVTEDKVRLWK